MIIYDNPILPWSAPLTHQHVPPYNVNRLIAYRRLDAVFMTAPTVYFDDTTRLVFFSDCHRGDNSRVDAFSVNEALFLHALQHYYQNGFTYIEVGDGDELWKNHHFNTVRAAHGQVFEWLHRFDWQQRLHLLFGNHDISGPKCQQVHKDGMIAREGLILQHRRTGQQLFVTHGHQADLKSDTFYRVSRMAVRRVWRRLQVWRLAPVASANAEERVSRPFERFLTEWSARNSRVLICGHTHRITGATYGETPYFNTGHCVTPGIITGLEIQNGEIGLVRWRATSRNAVPFQREALRAPCRLEYFN
ncbi:MAG: serine/threonine protein phosphatase [Anaerolineae bacterium]|nr:serine/threonine protein phosphatase [Anaerolineae bacterium]